MRLSCDNCGRRRRAFVVAAMLRLGAVTATSASRRYFAAASASSASAFAVPPVGFGADRPPRHCPATSSSLKRTAVAASSMPFGRSFSTQLANADGDGDDDDAGEGFFADPSIHPTFASLGITSPALLARVENYLASSSKNAKVRPSAVQSAAFAPISSGSDVTLGAETGSGKTLAYLLPLLDDILRRKSESAAAENGGKGKPGYLGYDYARAVILVPNKELVNQVVRMASELSGGEGRCVVSNAGDPSAAGSQWGPAPTLGEVHGDSSADDDEDDDDDDDGAIKDCDVVRLAVLPGGLNNPRDFRPFRNALNDPTAHPPVDLLVTTPANLGPMGLSPKNIDLFADVQTLVIDEADMLLDGGYVRQLNDVLMGFRRADKLADRSSTVFRKKAAADGDGSWGAPLDATTAAAAADDSASSEQDDGDDNADSEDDDDAFAVKKTQHVLVAATLPDFGLKSVSAYIDKKFPTSERISLNGMHNARHSGLRQQTAWIRDAEDIGDGGNKVRMEKLVEMLRTPSGDNLFDDEGNELVGLEGEKVMVFLNTKEDVEGVSGAMGREGVDCVPYHAKLKLGERTKNLDRFRRYRPNAQSSLGDGESEEEEELGEDEWGNTIEPPVPVLVCTDLASRGLDVPAVSAVVQLQFAGNVVAHLHRMGRCGRAGRVDGRGVVFYGDTEAELVEVVREAEGNQDELALAQDVEDLDEDDAEEGETKAEKAKVGGAFSRRRGFTRKRKKIRREAREAAEAEAGTMGDGED